MNSLEETHGLDQEHTRLLGWALEAQALADGRGQRMEQARNAVHNASIAFSKGKAEIGQALLDEAWAALKERG